MEALVILMAGASALLFLILTFGGLMLILAGCIGALLGVSSYHVRVSRAAGSGYADSRLSVLMWNDIAAILDERR